MIRLALMVGLGGFLGSALRFLIAQLFLKIITQITPLGTLLVNVLGSFLFGFLFQISGRMDRETYLLLSAGFCGGFTTFSTFTVENINLLMNKNAYIAGFYMLLSLVLGLGAAGLGWYLGKKYY